MLKKIGDGILMVIGYFFALWPITVPLIIWIGNGDNFDKAVTFIKKHPIELLVVSIVLIVCIAATLIINNRLKKKYKTDYASYSQKQAELREKETALQKRYDSEILKAVREKGAELQRQYDIKFSEANEMYEQAQSLKREFVTGSSLYPCLKNTQTYSHICASNDFDRFFNFIYDETHNSSHNIKNLSVSAQIETSDLKVYNTTLNGCDCPDYKYNLKGKSPCKHMYMLAHTLTLFNNLSLDKLETYAIQKSEVDKKRKILEYDLNTFNKEKEEFERHRRDIEHNIEIETSILESQTQDYPFAAQIISECLAAKADECADYLEQKNNPAPKAADKLREYAAQLKTWVARAKIAENQLAFYEELFPWLCEFKEIAPNDAWDMVKNSDNIETEYDHYKNWLSPEEYNRLSKIERNQLALDRYKKRHKTNWEIGIEYERYVGYKYEMQGYRVSYIGATRGLEDMGRDLLVQSKDKTYIVQCKRWAQEKTIHEKHIFQLYGTTVLYKMSHPKENIQPLFVTTADLSDTAKEVADYLGITIVNNYIVEDYPLIKCNIGKDGEKIYHLPFDQQYDHVVVVPSKGEGYAYTIEEAEHLGFRHAFRWHSA